MVLRRGVSGSPHYVPDFDARLQWAAMVLLGPIESYFRYEIRGLEQVPRRGPVLIVTNTGPLPIHALLLGRQMRSQVKRAPRILLDERLAGAAPLRELTRRLGLDFDDERRAEQLLAAEELVIMMPGGAEEAFKNPRLRYRLLWSGREGLASVAIRTQATVIPAACYGVDDMYRVVDAPARLLRAVLGPWVPALPLLLGAAGTLLPRPVRLIQELGMPIRSQYPAEAATDPAIARGFHRRILGEVQSQLDNMLLERGGFASGWRGSPRGAR